MHRHHNPQAAQSNSSLSCPEQTAHWGDGLSKPSYENRVVLVTGPSGAGRSTTINALEDLGYETIDNLPLSLIFPLIKGAITSRPIALGVDVRNRDFSTSTLIDLIDKLTSDPTVNLDILYLDCKPEVLIRRYNDTRRRHPLAPSNSPREGIIREIDLLIPIRARADHLIDTTELTIHALKAEVAHWFSRSSWPKLSVLLQSFSYKRGLPMGLDMMFDCRFLRNPHWDEALRHKDGSTSEIQKYIMQDERFAEFYHKVSDIIDFLLPAQQDEGKSHLSIGFGCTGGQHRSVAMVEIIGDALANNGWAVSKRHRELERNQAISFQQEYIRPHKE